MHHFSPEDIDERTNYKLLIGSIIPRPIALTTSLSANNKLNVAPFSYFNIVTSNPPMVAIGLQRNKKTGEMNDTARNITERKEAVIHIVDRQMVENANETAANLVYEESELPLTDFTLVDSEKVMVPGIKESKVRMETVLYDKVVIEDDGFPTTDLVLLKIVYYHVDETIYEDGRIDPRKLDAVSRLAGHDYGDIGKIRTIDRPD